MSGPKCGEVSLYGDALRAYQERLEEQRRQYEREEARRRAEQRRLAEEAARQRANRAITAAAAEASKIASGRLAQFVSKAETDEINASVARARDAEARGNHSDAERAAKEAQRIAAKAERLAEARREEEEARRERELKRGQAMAALAGARRMAEYVSGLPHERFAPGELGKISARLDAIDADLKRGSFEEVTRTAKNIVSQLDALETKVRKAHDVWLARRTSAERTLGDAREIAAGVDRDQLQRWAPDKLREIDAALSSMESAFGAEDFDGTDARAGEVKKAVSAAKERADRVFAKEREREEIVSRFKQALYDMGFEVGAHLENPSSPTSAVVVEAYHPSGQEAHARVDLNPTDSGVKVDFNLDDDPTTGSRNGADCIKTAEELVERMRQQGAAMKITDYGKADPNRARAAQNQKAAPTAKARGK